MNKKDVRKIATWMMELQTFDFEIEHRPGNKMQHVDALSRMYIIQTPGITHSMIKAQNDDEHISTIKELIKNQQYKDYVMHNGLLCKYNNAEYLIVVPEAMEMNLILKVHQNGHFKTKKIEAMLKKEFFIQNLQHKIEKVITNCIECILAERKTGKQEGKLHPIDKEAIPLDTLHIDHLGPMPSTNKNYNHILVIVDAFTKFVWLYPVKSTTAAETIEKLQNVTNIFGQPRRIITDKGTAFTATSFQDHCKNANIMQIFTTTGVPRGNGQVERINRIIINVLTKLSMENPNEWFKHVNKVQSAINQTYQRSINTTPFQLMFGIEMKNIDTDIRKIINEEIIEDFNNERQQLRDEAKSQISKIAEENKKTFNKKRKDAHQYEINDLVAIAKTQFSTGAKVKQKYLGPYKITKSNGKDRYEVEKIGQSEGPFKTTTSADHMKIWPSINMIKLVQTPTSFKTILIEGNIGSGKSTFLNYLQKQINSDVFPEPIPRWTDFNGHNLLQQVYDNPTEWIAPFQLYAALTLYTNHLKETTKPFKIMERSIYSSRDIFLTAARINNIIHPIHHEIIIKWLDFIEGNIKINVDLIIYLKCEPKESFNRIKERNRPEEKNIQLSYIELLNELYEQWIHENKQIEVITIDSNKNETEILTEYDQAIKKIKNL